MESRFRFRAWYKEASYMITNIRLPVGDGTIYGWYTNRNNLRDSDYFHSNDCVIMQCIGLTDKYGNDIYEGDIVEFSEGSRFSVYWDGDKIGFWFNEIGAVDYDMLDGFCEYDLVIIGNIYQNPELIKSRNESEAINAN